MLSLPDERLPDILFFDEPELGLHPHAITLVSEMLKRVAKTRQVFIATQSPYMVDCFDLENIVVADAEDGATKLRNMPMEQYQQWLDDDYLLSDIWLKTPVGGVFLIKVCIVCEGATEVEFVKSCLTPHLLPYGVNAYPTFLQAPSGRHRGGRVTVERLARFISHQYHATDRLTTLVDFYGFQGADGRTRQELEQGILDAVANLTRGFDPRFIRPYVQMHEFEGLLFSDVQQFQFVLDGWDNRVRNILNGVRSQFSTPEDINNSRDTAPSKRILAAFSEGSYSKTEHGPVIAEAIGLSSMRQQCPQFDGWMTMLEAWGTC